MSATGDPDAPVEEAPVIVDCDVLEAAKENIQPLARGRRVTALQSLLTTPHAQRESRLAATRNRLRMNVQLALENSANDEDNEDDAEEDEEADPVDAYCQYVDWVVENYPQGHSAESGLLELLEEATRVLKDHQGGKWRGDMRYLKLWTLYATYVEKPAVIYKFCMVNEIGTSHALLYEESAIALERAGRKAQADETYLLGIARKAAPLERLETKYAEFQKRMMASPTLPSEPAPADPEPSAAPTKGRRAVLGEASTRSSTRATRSSSRAVSNPIPAGLPSPAPARPQPNARIPVFVDSPDPDFGDEENKEEEPPSAWPELGTRKSRVKENIREATKAAGTTLRQPGRAQRTASGGTSKIMVYRDPAPEDDGENSAPVDTSNETPPPPPKPAGSKSRGKAIPVFRDEPEPASVPSSSKTKSPIAVFRDEEPAVPSPATRTTRTKAPSKSPIAVFRDEEPEEKRPGATKSSKSKASAKSPIPVFRDEEPAPSTKSKAGGSSHKSKSSIAVFRDEGAASPVPKPGKSAIAVFRDDSPKEPVVKPKARSAVTGKSKIAVFCDDDAEVEEKPRAVALGKAKSSIPVFRDEPGPSTRPMSPPAFTPYRDEEAPASPTKGAAPMARARSLGAGLGITGLGGVGTIPGRGNVGVKISSEAEALRRDPLKNYADDEKVELD